MKRLQAFKFQLRPNGEQVRQMRSFAGSCRFVYNRARALQKERFDRGEKKLGYAELCKQLTLWKQGADTAWLSEAPSQPLQQTLKDLDRAYTNFFAKRTAFPRFKKKGQRDSFRYPDPKQIKLDQANSRIFLPKLGWLRYHNSREILGTVKNVTVSSSNGKWYISIQTEREIKAPAHPSTSMVGVDVGVAKLATLSDGAVYSPVSSYQKNQKRLARLQRQMSRKIKFSKNWKKTKTRVQQLHSKIANTRRDYLHKTTTEISKNHAIIVLEDLQVKNMSASAKGSIKAPGRNVRAKSGLNKSIMDQGWFEFRRQLEYKQAWRGGEVLSVNPAYTSQTCSICGHVAKENRQTQVLFSCVECGHTENADLNAARNILAAGHAVLACGESVQSGRSMNQEPTEASRAIA
jgi:putative transposase